MIRKGGNPQIDSYSGFYENDKETSTGESKKLDDDGNEYTRIVYIRVRFTQRKKKKKRAESVDCPHEIKAVKPVK